RSAAAGSRRVAGYALDDAVFDLGVAHNITQQTSIAISCGSIISNALFTNRQGLGAVPDGVDNIRTILISILYDVAVVIVGGEAARQSNCIFDAQNADLGQAVDIRSIRTLCGQ